MSFMNQFLATIPFDIYELTLFQLVAETGSFTRAAERAGLTQSAITRQIRGWRTASAWPCLSAPRGMFA